MKELVKHARAVGITAFTATVAGDNAGSLRVLGRAGRVDRWERAGALIEVDVALPEAAG